MAKSPEMRHDSLPLTTLKRMPSDGMDVATDDLRDGRWSTGSGGIDDQSAATQGIH